jgi:hypothetical protein
MANSILPILIGGASLLADGPPQSALRRMDPQTRTKVLAALAGFVILGFGLVLLAWLGARVTRRYMNQEPLRRRDPAHFQDDWASRPLVPPESTREQDGEQ